eukprot:20774_1
MISTIVLILDDNKGPDAADITLYLINSTNDIQGVRQSSSFQYILRTIFNRIRTKFIRIPIDYVSFGQWNIDETFTWNIKHHIRSIDDKHRHLTKQMDRTCRVKSQMVYPRILNWIQHSTIQDPFFIAYLVCTSRIWYVHIHVYRMMSPGG